MCCGFEEEKLEEIRKDSPTCSRENFHLVLAIFSAKEWPINSLDIKSAFFQENEINRDVFLKPKEAGTSNIWKLNMTVYGLCNG